jgi:DUF4097 and DUF4098 domain-containing protein YvlB
MSKSKLSIVTIFILLLAAAPAASGQQTQDWQFDRVTRVEIDGVSGDLTVRAGSGGGVMLELEQDVTPDDAFRPEVEESGGIVRVREDWRGRNSRGSVEWILTVPADAELVISFDTASGDLDASGVSARFDFDTASGDVRLADMTIADGSSFDTASGDLILTDTTVGDDVDLDTASGDVELTRVNAGAGFAASTASGDVFVEDSDGVTRASTASGNVRVGLAEMTGPGDFSSASGNVTVRLDTAVAFDIEASSASGDVRLEAPMPGSFTLVMSKRRDRGSIDSPFEPTSEEEFERNGRMYVRQTVVRGSGGPEIRLSTASGSIRVTDR